jgi:ABC-type dipeptide/oligopeptide/nickel transport system permease subunit
MDSAGASATDVAMRVETEIPEEPRVVKTESKSPTKIALQRLRQDKVAVVCFGIFVFFVLIAIFAPLLARLEGQDIKTLHQELTNDIGLPTIGMTGQHWFGIEPSLGRDLFARWVYGARPSLMVATSASSSVSSPDSPAAGSTGRCPG